MPSKITKSDAVIFVLILLFVTGIILFVEIVIPRDHDYHNGHDYISKEYRSIVIPNSLQLVSKNWDDAHNQDKSLSSVWVYEYTIRESNSQTLVYNNFVTNLKNSKYHIVKQSHDNSLNSYFLEATNDSIVIKIEIGNRCYYMYCDGKSPSDTVFATASLPYKEPGFWQQ